MNRASDWIAQAEHDLGHSRHALEAGDYDWACFAAHQAAEKAVKGLILLKGGEGWGHSVTRLLRDLQAREVIPETLIQAGQRLDKHYIPTRYPSGFDTGAPRDYYTLEEAEKALTDAQRIYDFCVVALHRP